MTILASIILMWGCLKAHATIFQLYMCICYVKQNTPVSRPKCQGKCSHGPYSPVMWDTYCWILNVGYILILT